jgi:phage baseplate assembly protein W
MAGLTPKIPLNLDNRQGYVLIEDLKDLAIQNFLLVLMTNPGERIMDASFGVGIKKILFENFSNYTIANFEESLQRQVLKYTPYINIKNIDYSESDIDQGLLYIKMKILISPIGEYVTINVSKNGSIITNTESNI